MEDFGSLDAGSLGIQSAETMNWTGSQSLLMKTQINSSQICLIKWSNVLDITVKTPCQSLHDIMCTCAVKTDMFGSYSITTRTNHLSLLLSASHVSVLIKSSVELYWTKTSGSIGFSFTRLQQKRRANLEYTSNFFHKCELYVKSMPHHSRFWTFCGGVFMSESTRDSSGDYLDNSSVWMRGCCRNVVAENSRHLNNTALFGDYFQPASPPDFTTGRYRAERNFSELETDKNKTRDKENDLIVLSGILRSWIKVRNSR